MGRFVSILVWTKACILPKRHRLNESLYRTKKEQSYELLFLQCHY